MNIHEHQGKQLLKRYDVDVPRGLVVSSAHEGIGLSDELPKFPLVLKAQIHSGGRGKAGGIKFVKNLQKVIRRFISRHLKRLGKGDGEIKQITEKLQIKLMSEILSSDIDFSDKQIISESIENLVVQNLINELKVIDESKK